MILDTDGKSSSRHISGSDSIQTNNSQVPLTSSVARGKMQSLENSRRVTSAIESLLFLNVLGNPDQRLNLGDKNQVLIKQI